MRLFAGLVATSVVVTVANNGSRGSVPLTVLFHRLTNPAYSWEGGATGVPAAQDDLTVLEPSPPASPSSRVLGRSGLSTDVTPETASDSSTGGASVE